MRFTAAAALMVMTALPAIAQSDNSWHRSYTREFGGKSYDWDRGRQPERPSPQPDTLSTYQPVDRPRIEMPDYSSPRRSEPVIDPLPPLTFERSDRSGLNLR